MNDFKVKPTLILVQEQVICFTQSYGNELLIPGFTLVQIKHRLSKDKSFNPKDDQMRLLPPERNANKYFLQGNMVLRNVSNLAKQSCFVCAGSFKEIEFGKRLIVHLHSFKNGARTWAAMLLKALFYSLILKIEKTSNGYLSSSLCEVLS